MLEKIKSVFAAPVKPGYVIAAEKELGQTEKPGAANNPKISAYHKTCALKDTADSVPWCSSFLNWCAKVSGYERSHSAQARSWLGVGVPLKRFEPYCVVVFKRGTNPWMGHVSIGVEDLGTHIRCLGGNQSNRVSYALYPKASVLGYRRLRKI